MIFLTEIQKRLHSRTDIAAALGGNLSIIGAPGNLMGVNALQEMGLPTSFFMYAPAGVPAWMQYTSLAVLVVVVLAMVFEDQIGIALLGTACIRTCVLVLTGVISEKEALKSIDLKLVLLFGGSPALASALDSTGAATRSSRL